jgi:thiamine biosynthesis lipoprotein
MQYPADRLPGGPRPRRLPRAYLAPLVLLALVLAGCREAAPAIGSRFPAFGTQTDLSLVGVSPAQAERATATIRSDFELLERELDPWAPGPLGRVNLLLAKGEPFVAPPSVLPLIRLSQGLAQQSGGLLNPAAGRLTELWGFNRPTRHPGSAPSAAWWRPTPRSPICAWRAWSFRGATRPSCWTSAG